MLHLDLFPFKGALLEHIVIFVLWVFLEECGCSMNSDKSTLHWEQAVYLCAAISLHRAKLRQAAILKSLQF